MKTSEKNTPNSLIPVIIACTKVAQITESNFYFDSHTYAALIQRDTHTECGVNRKKATVKKKPRSVNISRSHFPQCFIEFSSERWSFCYNLPRFFFVHRKIAKRKPESANATPCFRLNTLRTFHLAVSRSALPASPNSVLNVPIHSASIKAEHVGKLFYSKFDESIKCFKLMTTHRYQSPLTTIEPLFITVLLQIDLTRKMFAAFGACYICVTFTFWAVRYFFPCIRLPPLRFMTNTSLSAFLFFIMPC